MAERGRVVLGQVIAVKPLGFGEFEQSQPLLEKGAEPQVVAVEMVEYSEFEPGHGRNH